MNFLSRIFSFWRVFLFSCFFLPFSFQSPAAGISMADAVARWENTSEGLMLLGPEGETANADEFDPTKPSVIFVHGWQNRKYLLPEFINAEVWRERFNLFLFRWHKRAFDNENPCPIDGELLRRLTGIPFPSLVPYPDGCPKDAEQRVWSSEARVGEFFVEEYKRFFGRFDPGLPEIRVVAVSLGTQPAVYFTYRLWEEGWNGPRPIRLELIDPYVGMQLVDGTGQMPSSSPYPIPPDAGLPDFVHGGMEMEGCTPAKARSVIYCVLENSLHRLRTVHGLALVTHWTATGMRGSSRLGGRAEAFMHVQRYSWDWLCPRAGIRIAGHFVGSRDAQCLWGVRDDLVALGTGTHNGAIWAHFWSLGETPPQGGITALTPTAELIRTGRSVWQQKSRNNWCNLPGRWNWMKVFRTVFIGEGANDALQPRLSTRTQFVERMQSVVGLDAAEAAQCGDALSLANDEFEEVSPFS